MELGRGLGRGWEMRQSCGNHQARSPLSVSAGFWCPRGFFGAVFCPVPSSVTPGGAGPAAPEAGNETWAQEGKMNCSWIPFFHSVPEAFALRVQIWG